MYSNKLICDILVYINENICSKISIQDLENKFFYNKFYIIKLFKKEIGLTIIDYINTIRIYKSIKYMKQLENNLLNISIKSGFYSQEYFSETFKKITNITPKKFQKYFKNSQNISSEDISKIRKAIIKLYEISLIKDKYLSKQKPTTFPTKKLSIFK